MSDRGAVGDAEHRKLKRKMIEESEPPTVDAKSEEFLTLRLMVGEPSSSKPTEASNNEERTIEANNQRQFSCKFCSKKFHSSQALGGHQNAHRRERVLCKIDKELDMGTFGRFGPHFCPYSAMASLPFRESPVYRGAHHHMHPLPHMYWPRYGQQRLANSALEAYRLGMRSSLGGEGGVQRRLNRRNNVQSSSLASANPEGSVGASASVGGFQRNLYMGNMHGSSSGPDLSLSL